ncbi:hypothetical protein DL769_004871 [Monosporascus sp. CRB-8-3]|nr:hypothetical protein DL769_004871 [Monosporascus sp. CRB-8-3]
MHASWGASPYHSYGNLRQDDPRGVGFERLGDVYVLQDSEFEGPMEGINFRPYLRVLLNNPSHLQMTTPAPGPAPVMPILPAEPKPTATPRGTVARCSAILAATDNSRDRARHTHRQFGRMAVDAMALVAAEAALELSKLQADARFVNLGVDT